MSGEYHRPETIDEALRIARERGPVLFLSGGTAVDPRDLFRAPGVIVDLAALGLEGIEIADGAVRIGARVTLQRIVEAEGPPAPLARAARTVGSRNVRNMATIGGHVARGETVGDLIPTLVALEARLAVATEGGTRDLSVPEWLATLPESVAGAPAHPPGLLTHVIVPLPVPGRHTANRAFKLIATDRSIVAAAVSLTREDGLLRRPIVAVGGIAPRVVRLPAVEAALDGRAPPERDEVERAVRESVRPVSDFRASAEYRALLAGVLVETALRAAWEEVRP